MESLAVMKEIFPVVGGLIDEVAEIDDDQLEVSELSSEELDRCFKDYEGYEVFGELNEVGKRVAFLKGFYEEEAERLGGFITEDILMRILGSSIFSSSELMELSMEEEMSCREKAVFLKMMLNRILLANYEELEPPCAVTEDFKVVNLEDSESKEASQSRPNKIERAADLSDLLKLDKIIRFP